MTDKPIKTNKTSKKRLSKGIRTYIRRLKAEARKEGTVYTRPLFLAPQQKKNED